MPQRVLTSFLPSRIPAFSRFNYRHELTSVSLMSLAVACVDGNVVGVIARKAFDAGDIAVTLLASSAALATITSFLWARAMHARDRVKATVLMQIGAIVCVVACAAAPFTNFGIWMLVGFTLLARVFITGIITARADIWRANYPRRSRGKITGKLSILAALILGLAPIVIAGAMDAPWGGEHAFRVIFVIASIAAVFGAMSFSRIRWRGRAAHLAEERARKHESGHAAGARAMLSVLKTDQNYRRYMVAMFVLGLPNIAGFPLFVLALDDQFRLNYTQSISLTQVLPVLVPVLVIPFWARMIDRMHIIRFRMFHAWVFVTANLLMGVGFLTQSLETLFVARFVLGIAFGGGMLAWNLGHHDFAKRELATIYMGIHVTLTGVRGLIGPFIGLLMYRGLALPNLENISLQGLGPWTFIVLGIANAFGGLLFLRLHVQTRTMQQSQLAGAHDNQSPERHKSV